MKKSSQEAQLSNAITSLASDDLASVEKAPNGIATYGQAKREALWTKNFFLLSFSSFTIFFALQILLPTLPVFSVKVGGDEATVGLVIGIFTLTATLIRPVAGILLDSIGRRQILLWGTAFFAIISLTYNFAVTVPLLLLIRLFHGLGWSFGTTASGTVATDIIPRSRLGEGMGFVGLMPALSMALAPAIGLWIIQHWNFNILFIASGISAGLSLLAAAGISHQETISRETSGWRQMIKLDQMFEPRSYRASLLMMLSVMTFGAVISFIALYAQERGIQNVGIFFSVYALMLLVTRPLAGKMIDSRGPEAVVWPGLLFVILSMATLWKAFSFSGFVIAAGFFGIGMGAVMTGLQTLAVMDVDVRRRGAATGTFFASLDMGIGLGAILLGIVAKHVDYATVYLVSAIPVLIGGLLFWHQGRKGNQL